MEAQAAPLNVACSCSWEGSITVGSAGDSKGPLRMTEQSAADTSSCLKRAEASAVHLHSRHGSGYC